MLYRLLGCWRVPIDRCLHGEFEPLYIDLLLYVFLICTTLTAQVSRVNVESVISNRSALVSWTPLTLHQARGLHVYFVTHQPSSVQAGRVALSTLSSPLIQRWRLLTLTQQLCTLSLWTLAQQGKTVKQSWCRSVNAGCIVCCSCIYNYIYWPCMYHMHIFILCNIIM